MAVEGVTTKEVFETYVEHFVAPELEPGQEVVVMDNLGAHRPERVRQLIEGRGCELIYLPPYSPDLLNPIRGSLREDKAHPQEDVCPRQGGSHRGDGAGIGRCRYRRRTGFFAHCGYRIPAQQL